MQLPARTLAAVGLTVALAACSTGVTRAAPSSQRVTASASLSPPPARTPARTASPHAPATVAAPAPPANYGNEAGTAPVPAAAAAVSVSHPDHVVGAGTPASCTSAVVVKAVGEGGVITFDCGPGPVTITMTATAKVSTARRTTVIDGGGLVTLSGAGQRRILYMDACGDGQACWQQQWPELVVQNLAFRDGYSPTRQADGAEYGGGAIYVSGGQLKVVNSGFFSDGCYQYGPDLGGGAIRAVGMYPKAPVYITKDTFTGNACSNGAALSGLFAGFDVIDSVLTGNKAIGWGQNPAQAGTPGGGSGGAIYTDGNAYDLTIAGTVITGNAAREGGGAIFFVVNSGGGTLTIDRSTLRGNPSGTFQNAPGIFDSVDGSEAQPALTSSTLS